MRGPTARQVLPESETLPRLNLSSVDWSEELELGMDQLARSSLDQMDRALLPSGPIERKQASLVGNKYRMRRDIRPVSEEEISWQMRVSSS